MTKFVNVKSEPHNIELIHNGVDNPSAIILCMHGFNGDRWGDGYGKLKSFEDILVCSYDSAGHGNSEVSSLDMRMKLINQETIDVITYIEDSYPNVPIIMFSNSYGSYRSMYYMQNHSKNIKHVICVNPAFRMLNILEKLKEFEYELLDENSKVVMKRSLGKFMSKAYLDDLYNFKVNDIASKLDVPVTIVIGDKDTLIPREHIDDFVDITNCSVIHVNDDHCLEDDNSWKTVIEYIRSII